MFDSQGYENLDVWQKSMNLVTDIYAATSKFPKEELYTLTSQIRRAAISIPSNIAEGRSRRTTRDFMRFVVIARGSVAELETQLRIGQNLSYLTSEQVKTLLDNLKEIGRMLSGLIAKLESKLKEDPP